MKNIKFLLFSGFFILLMISTPSIQAQDLPAGLNTVGVNQGDSFNIKVLANDFDLKAIVSEVNDLGFNFSEIGLNDLKFELYDEVVNEQLIPEANDIIVITVENLPAASSLGKISLELDGVTNDFETGFVIGTPVTFIDWNVWETYLQDLVTKVKSESEISISLIINNSATKFSSNLFLDFPIPDQLKTTLTSIKVTQEMVYDKTTGIQEMMKVDLTYKSTSDLVGTQSQSLHYVLTDENPSTSNAESSIETTTSPGFEIFGSILSVAVFSVLIKYKKRYN